MDLTRDLGTAYDAFKASEIFLGTSKKPAVKQDFLNAATEEVAKGMLAIKSVRVTAASEKEAREEALKRSPRWVSTCASLDGDSYLVLLKENAKYKSFTFVNKDDKRVWTKQVVDGSPYVDEDALQAADPKLWERITVPVRELKPLEELDPDDLARLESFVYPGKSTEKLAAPRKAKADELEGRD